MRMQSEQWWTLLSRQGSCGFCFSCPWWRSKRPEDHAGSAGDHLSGMQYIFPPRNIPGTVPEMWGSACCSPNVPDSRQNSVRRQRLSFTSVDCCKAKFLAGAWLFYTSQRLRQGGHLLSSTCTKSRCWWPFIKPSESVLTQNREGRDFHRKLL